MRSVGQMSHMFLEAYISIIFHVSNCDNMLHITIHAWSMPMPNIFCLVWIYLHFEVCATLFCRINALNLSGCLSDIDYTQMNCNQISKTYLHKSQIDIITLRYLMYCHLWGWYGTEFIFLLDSNFMNLKIKSYYFPSHGRQSLEAALYWQAHNWWMKLDVLPEAKRHFQELCQHKKMKYFCKHISFHSICMMYQWILWLSILF